MPAVRSLRHHDRSALRGDLLAALVVTALMVPQALGYAALAGAPGFEKLRGIFENLEDVNTRTALVGVISLVGLFVGPRVARVVPWGLVLVVGGLIVSRAADLSSEGVAVIGSVPAGLPGLAVPDLPISEMATSW